jgi:general secretion pathway protein D
MKTKTIILLMVASFIISLSGCSLMTWDENKGKADEMATQKRWDEAVVYYTEALKNNPNHVEIRLRLESAKRMASKEHLKKARAAWEIKDYEQAMLEYRTAKDLDSLNRAAVIEFNEKIKLLTAMQDERRSQLEAEQRGELEAQNEDALMPLNINDELKQSFNFPNRAVGDIYQAMSKLADLNVIYHDSVRQSLRNQTDFMVDNVTFWEGFNYFLLSNNHFFRMVNENTVLIIDGTNQNRQAFEEKAVRVFYLSNSDVRDVYAALRMVMPGSGQPRLAQMRSHNAILLKDTPAKIAIVSKLIEQLDKPKAEVILDVEFLEVESSLVHDVGALLSSYSIGQTFRNNEAQEEGTVGQVAMNGLDSINRSNFFLTIPAVAYNMVRNNNNTRLLAKPQLRITDGEVGELHIGEEIPYRSSTFNPGSASGIGAPVDSYQLKSTGIKFNITPRVHNNGEVTMEMEIELSALGTSGVVGNPSFTTRKVKSTLRLQDGETNLLAGLIREEKKYNETGIAGLSDIPILGKLFSNHARNDLKTDIIVSITPHIVRGGTLTLQDMLTILSGPEANPAFGGMLTDKQIGELKSLRGIAFSGKAGNSGNRNMDMPPMEPEFFDEEDEQNEREQDNRNRR